MKTSFCIGIVTFLIGCEATKPQPAPVEAQLEAPAEGAGWQWNIAPFAVAAGTEQQDCYFFAVPGTPGQDVWVDQITVAQNLGSHHMNLFRVKTATGLAGKPGDVVRNGQCFGPSSNWADWPIVINSQSAGKVDWKLPTTVGYKFTAGEILMAQTHFVNATTQQAPLGGKVLINFYTPKTPPANELGTLFATNQHIRVCPGDVDKKFEAHCTFPSQGVHIVAANGHFHSRGTRFSMTTVDPKGVVGGMFYQSTSWDEPPMARDLDVLVPQNGGIGWECAYDYACPDGAASCGNPADNGCFNFGGHVDTQEHCNAFVYYWPKVADIGCF